MRRIAWLHVILLLLVLPAGCDKPDKTQPAGQAARQLTVGVSLWKTDDPWRAQMKADIETAAAKHPNLKLVVKDAENDAQRQRADVEQFLADRVKAIIVSPKDAQTLTEPAAKAFDAGIPVVVVDRPLVGGKYTCIIRPDNKQIGAAAAKWLAGRLGGKGKIVEIKGPVDSIPNQQRHEAFRAALRDPGYRFVYENCVDPPNVTAEKLMGEALGRVAQIDAVFAYSDEAAHAAYQAAKLAGREKGLLFVGIDALPAGGQALVSQGILDATLLRPTGGSEAVEAAVKLLAGQTVPKEVTLPTRLFTKQSVPHGGEAVEKP